MLLNEKYLYGRWPTSYAVQIRFAFEIFEADK
jgi:hypothetical protein